MDILQNFGVTDGNLVDQATGFKYPPVTSDKVHIDADLVVYQAAAGTEVDELGDVVPLTTAKAKIDRAMEIIEHIRKLAGAADYHLHTTSPSSTKGDRPFIAIQKEYQANRRARTEPIEHLKEVRDHLTTLTNSTVHTDREADDGLAAAYYADNSIIIASKDKDLLMVPGKQVNLDTGEISRPTDNFGYIAMTEVGKTKKLVGRGTKFFWAQLLMGDTADNIQGCPCVTKGFLHNFDPVTKLTKLYKNERAALGTDLHDNALRALEVERDTPVKIGPAKAFKILENLNSDAECFDVVRLAYKSANAAGHVYTHWETGKEVDYVDVLISAMKFLWMRRTGDPEDVLKFLREVHSEKNKKTRDSDSNTANTKKTGTPLCSV